MSALTAFCGSFDPVTLGHARLLSKAIDEDMTSRIVVGVRNNVDKCHLLTQENRIQLFQRSLSDEMREKILVTTNSPDEIQKIYGAKFLIRGIRNSFDLGYETNNLQKGFQKAARELADPLPVLWIFDPTGLRTISSSLAREALLSGSSRLYSYVAEDIATILLETAKATRPNTGDKISLALFNERLAEKLSIPTSG